MTHVLMPCEQDAAREHNRERRERREHVKAGELVWMRYENSKALREAIEALDTGGEFPSTVYTLHPVPWTSRLMQKRLQQRETNDRKRRGLPARRVRVERAASRYHRPRKTRFVVTEHNTEEG
jgi:hypothetical protein